MNAPATKRGTMRMTHLAIWIAVMAFAVSVPQLMAETGAFHDATKLVCSKCHTMHYSENDADPTGADPNGPFGHLLMKKNVTDLCLSCHSDPTKAPDVLNATIDTPGGDFDNSATTESKGHNPGGKTGNETTALPLDTTLGLKPPGRATSLTEFTCATCHDPHGEASKAFMFRNLKKDPDGDGTPASLTAGDTEESNIWDGSAANIAQSNTNHNVYKTSAMNDATDGFGNWCASCHPNFHGDSKSDTDVGNTTDWIRHPTAVALGGLATNYGTYDITMPLETTSASTPTTDAATWTVSGTTEGVTCLTCHKAHASQYPNATRWDNAAASGSGTNCNKCHAKG